MGACQRVQASTPWGPAGVSEPPSSSASCPNIRSENPPFQSKVFAFPSPPRSFCCSLLGSWFVGFFPEKLSVRKTPKGAPQRCAQHPHRCALIKLNRKPPGGQAEPPAETPTMQPWGPCVQPMTWFPELRQCRLTINVFNFSLDNGYIERKELDNFFHHLLEKLGPEVSTVPR